MNFTMRLHNPKPYLPKVIRKQLISVIVYEHLPPCNWLTAYITYIDNIFTLSICGDTLCSYPQLFPPQTLAVLHREKRVQTIQHTSGALYGKQLYVSHVPYDMLLTGSFSWQHSPLLALVYGWCIWLQCHSLQNMDGLYSPLWSTTVTQVQLLLVQYGLVLFFKAYSLSIAALSAVDTI